VDGLDAYLVNGNMIPVDQAGQRTEPEPEPEPEPGDEDEEGSDDADSETEE